GAGDLLFRELVQPQRQPLGAAAVVDEQDRRAVLLDQLQQLRIDRRPDRAPGCRDAVRHLAEVHVRVGLAHVLDWYAYPQVERLALARVDDGALARRPAQESRHLLERALGRRQADALQSPPRDLFQPLERQRQVRAALGARDCVDLVDDDRLRAVQELARARG